MELSPGTSIGSYQIQGPLGAGNYSFQASFAGDDNYNVATSAEEPFFVDKGTITLTTKIFNAADDEEIELNSHVALGTSAYDTVSIDGANANFAVDTTQLSFTFNGNVPNRKRPSRTL